MAKGKYVIKKKYIRAIEKKLREPREAPLWLKELNKRKEQNDSTSPSTTNNH